MRYMINTVEEISMENEEKRPYQTPTLILYGEISQITASGSGEDPEGNPDFAVTDEPSTYYG